MAFLNWLFEVSVKTLRSSKDFDTVSFHPIVFLHFSASLIFHDSMKHVLLFYQHKFHITTKSLYVESLSSSSSSVTYRNAHKTCTHPNCTNLYTCIHADRTNLYTCIQIVQICRHPDCTNLYTSRLYKFVHIQVVQICTHIQIVNSYHVSARAERDLSPGRSQSRT